MKGLRQGMKRIVAALMGAAILTLPMTVLAGEIRQDEKSGISAVYHDQKGDAINGMRVRIYKVADVKGATVDGSLNGYSVSYTLTDAFRQFDQETGSRPVTGFGEKALNDALIVRDGEGQNVRRARWKAIAATLESYAQAYVRPAGNKTTADGKVDFTDLTPGLYLMIADGLTVKGEDADYRFTYAPTFVMLPWYENGLWDYDRTLTFEEGNVLLRPKYTYERVEYNYVIYKRWIGDGTSVRPASIQVDIYRDGTLYRTVTLNESNNWTYRWNGGSQNWSVTERTTVSGYSVSIDSSKAGTFTIDNTYNPPEGDRRTPPPPPEEVEVEEPEVLGARRLPTYEPLETPEVLGSRRLPRTGQLDWPVPVLAIAGMLLFGIGYYRNRRNA